MKHQDLFQFMIQSYTKKIDGTNREKVQLMLNDAEEGWFYGIALDFYFNINVLQKMLQFQMPTYQMIFVNWTSYRN